MSRIIFPSSTPKKKSTASSMFKSRIGKSGKMRQQTMSKDDYKKFLEEKLKEKQRDMIENGISYGGGGMLPGTNPTAKKQLSDSAKELLQRVEAKKEKERKKKEKNKIIVEPTQFADMNGQLLGRMDKKGNIFAPNGTLLLRVDAKTGRIKTPMGMSMGLFEKTNPIEMNRIIMEQAKKAGAIPATMRVQKDGWGNVVEKDGWGNVVEKDGWGNAVKTDCWGNPIKDDNGGGWF